MQAKKTDARRVARCVATAKTALLLWAQRTTTTARTGVAGAEARDGSANDDAVKCRQR